MASFQLDNEDKQGRRDIHLHHSVNGRNIKVSLKCKVQKDEWLDSRCIGENSKKINYLMDQVMIIA